MMGDQAEMMLEGYYCTSCGAFIAQPGVAPQQCKGCKPKRQKRRRKKRRKPRTGGG